MQKYKCENCCKDFYRYRKSKPFRFCSNSCRGKVAPVIKKGNIPWNKGRIGWTKNTKAGFQKGEKNPTWNGGSSSFKDSHKREWVEWRKKVFLRDGYTCQHCGQIGGLLHPDHIKCFAHHPELRFVVSNGRTLCRSCHRKTATYGFHVCAELSPTGALATFSV